MTIYKASFVALVVLFYVSNASPLARSRRSVSFLGSEETFTSTTIATPPVDSYYLDIEEPLDGDHSPEKIEGGRPSGEPHHLEDARGLDQINESINESDHLQSREGRRPDSLEQANMIHGKQYQSKLSNESQRDDQSVTGYHKNHEKEEEAENAEVENSERRPEEPENFPKSNELVDSLVQSNEKSIQQNLPETLPIAEPENSGETDSSSVDSQNSEHTNDVAEGVSEPKGSVEPVAVANNTEEGERVAGRSQEGHAFPAETDDEKPLVPSSPQSSAQLFGDDANGMGMTHNVLNIDQAAGKDANIEIMYTNKNH